MNTNTNTNTNNIPQNLASIFQQQKSRLIHLLFSYNAITLLILLYMILQMWLLNQNNLIENASPSRLSFQIFALILAFAPLFLIAFYFNSFYKKLYKRLNKGLNKGLEDINNVNNVNSDINFDAHFEQNIFQKINKLLQISLIILHFYLFWVIISIEDLIRTFLKNDLFKNTGTITVTGAGMETGSSLYTLNIGCNITLAALCISLIYLYILHLGYLSPFKKYQKMLKNIEKNKNKNKKNI